MVDGRNDGSPSSGSANSTAAVPTSAKPACPQPRTGVSVDFKRQLSPPTCSCELAVLMAELAGFPFRNLEGLTINHN